MAENVESIVFLLQKASECLTDAELLLPLKRNAATVSRSYYAIFDLAKALLYSEDVFAKTHAGVFNKFSEVFIKENKLPSELVTAFRDAMEQRQNADYNFEKITELQAAKSLADAKMFLQVATDYLKANHVI